MATGSMELGFHGVMAAVMFSSCKVEVKSVSVCVCVCVCVCVFAVPQETIFNLNPSHCLSGFCTIHDLFF